MIIFLHSRLFIIIVLWISRLEGGKKYISFKKLKCKLLGKNIEELTSKKNVNSFSWLMPLIYSIIYHLILARWHHSLPLFLRPSTCISRWEIFDSFGFLFLAFKWEPENFIRGVRVDDLFENKKDNIRTNRNPWDEQKHEPSLMILSWLVEGKFSMI